ncbi:MAG: matrixin family metalloprotease [Candidatus Gastranaerophilales bacterium]|nr:matrixin family metalloprotease [Candidatus Gastranaerophilales bacterium]
MRINNIHLNNIPPQISEPGQKAEFKGINNSQPKGITDFVNELLSWRQNEKLESRKCPRWDMSRIPLKYFISNSDESDRFLSDFMDAAQSSFLPWSRASAGLIRFERVFNEDLSDIAIDWTDTTTPGRNFESGHADLKVLNNKIEKAKIKIVISPLIDNLASSKQRIERVRRTSLHEIGHALGLNHSENRKDMMYYRGINNNRLSSNDIKRLADLYQSLKPDIIKY